MTKAFLAGAAAAAGAVAAALAGPAAAQDVNANDPQTVVAALQAAGYRAALDKAESGDPVISSAAEGLNFDIWFYGCTKNVDCNSLQFSAGFDLPDAADPKVINDWNFNRLLGRASVDPNGDPWIDHYVLTDGGLRPETFGMILTRWVSAMVEFRDHIGR